MGVFDDLKGVVIGLFTVGLVVGLTFVILAQTKTQIGDIEGIDITNTTQCAASSGCAAIGTTEGAVDDLPGWLGLIVLAFIGVIIFGLVKMFKNN